MSPSSSPSLSPLTPARRLARREARRRQLRRRRWGFALTFIAVIAVIALVAGRGGGVRHAHARVAAPFGTVVRHSLPGTNLLREQRAVERVMSYTPYVVAGGPSRREIALTFDDGPGPYTPRLIEVLRKLRTPATFFQVGQSIQTFRAAALTELRDGYAIGDHTQNHAALAHFGRTDQRAQILKAAHAMRGVGTPFPRLFRPPYRSFDRTTTDLMRQLHMLMVLWSVDSADYRRPPAAVIAQRVLAGARRGAIILMHDAGGIRTATIAALPAIVHGLRRQGYKLVTIPRLLLDDPPTRGQSLTPPPGPGQ